MTLDLVTRGALLPDRNVAFASADRDLPGNIVLAVPHPDDESLGCGVLLSQIKDKRRVRFVFASNGAKSAYLRRAPSSPSAEGHLAELRKEEALRAIHELGYSASTARFLGLPDGSLSSFQADIMAALKATCDKHSACILLAPSRFDAHPDHLAVHKAAISAVAALVRQQPILLCEYFVYYRTHLLPGGDVRGYLRPECRLSFYSDEDVRAKQRAIDCHRTQRTRVLPRQTRPALTDDVVESTLALPEVICRPTEGPHTNRPLRVPSTMVRIAQSLEFRLKTAKDVLREAALRGESAATR